MRHIIQYFSICVLFISFFYTGYTSNNFLVRKGTRLYDQCNNEVRLTGVNWFGFETGNKAPHGLWFRDYQSMLEQIKDLGFNCIRLPWSNAILEDGTMPSGITTSGSDPYNGRTPMNDDLKNLTSIQVMDKMVAYCRQIGLKIMLDNHSRKPDGYLSEPLWYLGDFSEQKWINDWVTLISRYKDNDAVVAVDLNNEPHNEATWGSSNASTDWNKAAERCANAILQAHPEVLIVVEGVEKYNGAGYWWGGNLKGVKDHPVNLSNPEKLVYSTHEYGPEVHLQTWFEESDFPNNMPDLWDDRFGYIHNEGLGHVLVGEYGIKDYNANGGKAGKWFDKWIAYMGQKALSWTFWCMNPNSGDTGGILADDWVSVNDWKVNKIKPYMAPLIGACTPSPMVTINEINEEQLNNHKLYPNPLRDCLNISFFDASENLVVIEVFNSLGIKVISKTFTGSAGLEKAIDVSYWLPGVYMVNVSNREGSVFHKMIKQ